MILLTSPHLTLLCLSPSYFTPTLLHYPNPPHHILSSPNLPYRTLSCPSLPYTTLPCPTLPSTTLLCPSLPYPTVPFPTIPCPTMPISTLPYPTLPYHANLYPTLPCPTLPSLKEMFPISKRLVFLGRSLIWIDPCKYQRPQPEPRFLKENLRSQKIYFPLTTSTSLSTSTSPPLGQVKKVVLKYTLRPLRYILVKTSLCFIVWLIRALCQQNPVQRLQLQDLQITRGTGHQDDH